MIIHLVSDRMTLCGLDSLEQTNDSYTADISECNCRACLELTLLDITKKLSNDEFVVVLIPRSKV